MRSLATGSPGLAAGTDNSMTTIMAELGGPRPITEYREKGKLIGLKLQNQDGIEADKKDQNLSQRAQEADQRKQIWTGDS